MAMSREGGKTIRRHATAVVNSIVLLWKDSGKTPIVN